MTCRTARCFGVGGDNLGAGDQLLYSGISTQPPPSHPERGRVTDLVEIANKLREGRATQRSKEPSRSTFPSTGNLRPVGSYYDSQKFTSTVYDTIHSLSTYVRLT
jgi:hypothetical protein